MPQKPQRLLTAVECKTACKTTTRTTKFSSASMAFISYILLLGLISLQPTVSSESYFYHHVGFEELGYVNYTAATGNPLKGMIANPDFWYDPNVTSVDSSMDIWYFGLGDVMINDPHVVGWDAAFDWSKVEERLERSVAEGRHSVLTFNVHYPGETLRLPKHIHPFTLSLRWYAGLAGGGLSPNYGDTRLLTAMEQFISEFGRRYDGDNRVAFIHLGLLGFWGEWHTYPVAGLVPESSKRSITDAYIAAFSTTKLQGRYANDFEDNIAIGLYDGSFGFSTLDGEYNGGVEHNDWYFWPVIENLNRTDFWRTSPMAGTLSRFDTSRSRLTQLLESPGETRPELQRLIFEPTYPAGTYEHQDFFDCMEVTHATYIFHSDAFIQGGYSGAELESFLDAHDRLGYAFVVTAVDVAAIVNSNLVEVDITVEQVGIAPFYYPLSLNVVCDGLQYDAPGVESLIDRGDKRTFTFDNIPATEACLGRIEIFLVSPRALPGRPIKFAQGDGSVEVSVPFVWETNPSGSNFQGYGELVRLTLVQETDFGLQDFGSLHDGDLLSNSSSISIRADTFDTVSGVAFGFEDFLVTDFQRPFLVTDEDLIAELFRDVGEKVLTVHAYDYTGNEMGQRTISFEVGAHLTRTRLLEVARDISIYSEIEPQTVQEQHSIGQRSPLDLMHGFNTPATPTLLQVVSLEKEQETRTSVLAFADRMVGLLMLLIHGQ